MNTRREAPQVDVIIPVHTADRPVARAAGSVLDHTAAPVRVTLVCHEIEPARIAQALGARADDPRVRLLPFRDGVPSPAGPINAGLDAATATFTSLLGSDDRYAPGAIDAWLAIQSRDDADVVIPRVIVAPDRSLRTPPVRPFRSRRLDGVRDRLAYRTVQLGLISRELSAGIRMTPGLRTGEDVIQGASLWYSPARISFARRAPAYIVETGGGDRVSTTVRPPEEQLAFLDAVLAPDLVARLSLAEREAFAVKLLRTHVLDALRSVLDSGGDMIHIAEVARAASRVIDLAPTVVGIISRRDARILGELRSQLPALDDLRRHVALRTDFRRPTNLISARPGLTFHREAPLRLLSATALAP